MWIYLFSIASAVAICLSVAAFMLRDCGKTDAEFARLDSEDAPTAPNGSGEISRQTGFLHQSSKGNAPQAGVPEPGINALLADSAVQLMMHADHVGKGELRAELSAMSLQLRKNANPMFGFDRALCRLQNMSEMMSRLGLDTGALARDDFNIRSVFNACQSCRADEVCRDWLSRGPKSVDRAPAFCVNTEHFARTMQAA
jgi:hypothetical protein